MNSKQAEALKSRIQHDLERFRFTVRNDIEIGMPASIGIAVFPQDGTELESLLSVADWRLRQDSELREVVKRHAWLKS
jgi:GGDEF domain-containing protein